MNFSTLHRFFDESDKIVWSNYLLKNVNIEVKLNSEVLTTLAVNIVTTSHTWLTVSLYLVFTYFLD